MSRNSPSTWWAVFLVVISTTLSVSSARAQELPSASKEGGATNEEIAAFLAANIGSIWKVPKPFRVAIVLNGTTDLDIGVWPGSEIADVLRRTTESCGMEIEFVSTNASYQHVVSFADGPHPRAAASLRVIRENLAKEVERISDGRMSTSPRLEFSEYLDYPYFRTTGIEFVVQKRGDNRIQLRLPTFYSPSLTRFRTVIDEIVSAAPGSERHTELISRFRQVYLHDIGMSCPTFVFGRSIKAANLEVASELLVRVLSDDRIQAGMYAEELQRAAIEVLKDVRPDR